MVRIFPLLFVLFAISFIPVLAQQEEINAAIDIRLYEKDYDDFGFLNFFAHNTSPTIEILYGGPKTEWSGFKSSFGKLGTVELRAGYTKYSRYFEHIVKLNHSYFFLGNFSADLGSKTANSFSPEMWRFGLGLFYGYGYKVGDVSIIPYSSNSFAWSFLQFKNKPVMLGSEDADHIALYDKSLRFGTSSEGGVKLLLAPFLTLSAGYERAVVFPRYLVWKQLGSMSLEYCGLGAIDHFIKDIMKTSPYAGPVVDFILKNSYSYAFYELRKTKMNWPFSSTAPLMVNSWKIGMTFIF